jgi:O6-methylguanine-DNA--protein-cysteine methyltransferase
MYPACICVAADVKNSRQLDNRHLIIALQQCKTNLNTTFSEDLLIPFDVRNGDEIVGVLSRFTHGYRAGKALKDFMLNQGISLYLGLGFGNLETTDATIHTMNGSAVLNAFEARDRFLKDRHTESKPWNRGKEATSVFFYGDQIPYQALNALTYSILEKTENRSEKQNQVIQMLEQHPTWSYEQIGKRMGYKSPKSAVSYLLTRADYHVVQAMEAGLEALLEDLQQRYPKSEEIR